jgi:hypothetical protein
MIRRLFQLLGYVWATPTVLGALVFFLLPFWATGQLRPLRWHEGVWEWTIRPRSWLWRRYTVPGWRATTLGWCVFYSPGAEHDLAVAIHERRHVWQALWLGPLFFPIYGLVFLITGYHNHPLERDARAWEQKRTGRA